MEFSNKQFKRFLKLLNLAENNNSRQKLVDNFIAGVKNHYPIYESEEDVVLLYQGKAHKVRIIGDMTEWAHTLKLNNIAGTDLHYISFKLEPDACLEYWFMLNDNEEPVIDPLNPYIIYNGLGNISELAMPDYVRHPYFEKYLNGKKGDFNLITETELPAGALPYPHQLHIYLPPDYEKRKEQYPVIYFQDGRDYIEFAIVPYILNRLIEEKKIKAVIAVFVTPPNLHKPEVPNRMTEYGLNDDYVNFFINELVKYIDERYRTKRSPASRLVVGDSYGGLISTYIAFKHPEIFGMAYSQSGYHCFQKDRMINLFLHKPVKPIKLYIDSGTYEHEVGSTFLPEDERDFISANRRLRKILLEKKYDFTYNEYHEGHTWGNWRRNLIDALIYFFGI